MIATLDGQIGIWINGEAKRLVHKRNIPFALEGVVCVCHGYTFTRNSVGERLAIVQWYE